MKIASQNPWLYNKPRIPYTGSIGVYHIYQSPAPHLVVCIRCQCGPNLHLVAMDHAWWPFENKVTSSHPAKLRCINIFSYKFAWRPLLFTETSQLN